MFRHKSLLYLAMALAVLFASSAALAAPANFSAIIALPNGFRPEGIVSGYGTDFYTGSLANGAIYKGDYRTGQGSLLTPGQSGDVSVGLSFDKRTGYLFVAGGPTGTAKVIDTQSGAQVGFFTLTGPGSFINDVIVTQSGAFFTDSFSARLFKLPLSDSGALPDPSAVQTLDLTGDWVQAAGFNANGIEATPNGDKLIVVNSGLGNLYLVDAQTGVASLIDLGGASVGFGDGLLLRGFALYVVRNQLNEVAVIKLARDYSSGDLAMSITNPAFDIPTTIAALGSRLYVVNARFSTPPTPDTEYTVVRVVKP